MNDVFNNRLCSSIARSWGQRLEKLVKFQEKWGMFTYLSSAVAV